MTGTVLDAARAHFARMKGRTLEVPEWGVDGEPLVVHFDPLTLAERQAIQSRAKGSDAQAALLVVIRHAKDAAGARLFKDDAPTRAALETDADPAVIARIAATILGVGDAAALGE